eukprot:g7088.t1
MAEKSCAKADSFSATRFVSFWAKFQHRQGVGALFSGLQAASLRAATYGSVRIGLCEPLQEKAGRSGGALLAGVLATVVGNPFEVLKVRLQAEPGRGELQVLRDMLKTEGCLVLASGFGWAATRSSLLTLSQVVPYAHAKTALQQWCGFSEGQHMSRSSRFRSQHFVTTPANEWVLKRTLSAPSMPKEDPLPDLKKLNNPRWRRPKSSSDVSRYAEAFYNLNGCSPFALAAGK